MPARLLALVLVLAVVAPAAAQPSPPCAACTRGDELVEQLGLQPLRALAGELAGLVLDIPLTPAQYARIVELRGRSPALARVGAVEDADLAAIAAALCRAPAGACTDATAHALRCLADRCEVEFPRPPPRRADVVRVAPGCQESQTPKRTAPLGIGLSWGTGWHASRYPNDGRAWSLGLEARLRLGRRLGTVARIDRIAGRDEARDDGDGNDDVWTGSITRIAALAGPSIVFGQGRYEGEPRYLRLDLLAGYLSTRSQADESGPAAGVDLGYQLSILRIGVRFVQGFGDARDATTMLAHLGFVAGAAPPDGGRDDCGLPRFDTSSSRLALGFDLPLVGYGLSSELGLLATGLGLELAWNLTPRFDALARADLLLFPGYERERTIHQAVLAGVRIDYLAHRRRTETGFFTTVMGGYTHGAGLVPTSTGSGPVGDVSFGWGIQSREAAAHFRLHGRFGIGPDNLEYRAIFLSGGFELRLDPSRWRRRS